MSYKLLQNKIKLDFPIFTNHPDLVYLDSAATSQKPEQVIKAVTDFYTKYNSNVQRGIYTLSQEATNIYEGTRKKVADFIGASDPSEIIFTGNASEAINLVAYGYARKFLKPGDIIVLSEMEHHSNIVPWQRLQKEIGVELFFIPLTKNFTLDYKSVLQLEKKKIKLVALTQASNVLGTVNPISEITDFLKKNKIKAKVLVDAAQSIPHLPINIKELGCDFLAFSGHKMLGPSGVGVLWAKRDLLEIMDPLFVGSHMIKTVTKEKAEWADLPDKFEVGTGKLEAVAGLGAAIDYLQSVGLGNIIQHEKEIMEYVLEMFNELEKIEFYGKKTVDQRLGVFSFNIKGIHPHDAGEILNRSKICVRGGHHCAQPLMRILGVPGTLRVSLYLYNTKEDIDKLMKGIEEVKRVFNNK